MRTFGGASLLAVALVYLGALFLLAEAVERGWIPARIARHRWITALSMGVYASTWSFYGSVGYARGEGFRYLAIYLGVSLACLLVPVLWMPVFRLSQAHQLSSLADLFAFRYRSRRLGVAVTIFLLAGSFPYLAQQIRAIASTMHQLTGRGSHALLGLVFCAVAAAFAVLFGARHVEAREKHVGLVFAVAAESMVKLVALLAAAGFALFGVFDGPHGLAGWLGAHPEATRDLFEPIRQGSWGSLLLVSFAAAFLLPRQYHMAFTENTSERALRTTSWLFPLFLLLLNLAIPILLWAGQHTQPGGDPDTYVLTITLGSASPWLPVFVFLGGLSAATAMVIVTVLALASMCLNHLVLPSRRASQGDLYHFLRGARRWLVIAILAGAYAIYTVLGAQSRLVEVGLLSFVAVAQFLPGLVGVLFWRRATGRAVLGGLIAGIAVWLCCAVGPLLVRSHLLPSAMDVPALLGIAAADSLSFAIYLSLGANAAVLGWIGLRGEPTLEELARARLCIDAGDPVPGGRLEAGSPTDFTRALVPELGLDVAAREVARAIDDVGVGADEQRPAELRRLRDRLRRNLSGLVGPLEAEAILDAGLRLEPGSGSVAEQIQAIEGKLAAGASNELARELDEVRRYLGDLLDQLPVGVCAVGTAGEVVLWNRALAAITGVADDAVIGTPVAAALAPWGLLLDAFLRDPVGDRELRARRGDGEEGRFRIRKNHVMGTSDGGELAATASGVVVLVEDLTDRVTLEARLEHRERLALIGQLGATMAHEIGNPLAAIDSMAQNLQAELAEPDVNQRLQRIRDQVRHIVNIVSSMVAYSRADASSLGAPAAWFSVAEAVDEAVSLIRLGSSVHPHAIVNRCAAELRLFGDRTRLLQVFVNLVRNACDASPIDRPIEVRSHAEHGRAVIEIVDRGAGIPAAIRRRMFEPFVTTKQVGKGTGLGLSLVHNIVRDHGGSLEVESAVGEGTTVRLRLPLEPPS